ncbi:RHS repeat-associated protein [Flavobacterium sp. CG_9.1]|uniref:RHS repeat-associated core domain-containing protein n=1 Tax=Flavobacterium sp. CG_9.1 TaxID=2787728 RepID=UPI0018CB983B|nr:RHS repeat-associated core domain-containing protein [Flavobacterium sp. CG_9.1]MBG6063164.1 RHS repeat-associated protein [Flavobacterium sp. CG_9.1]
MKHFYLTLLFVSYSLFISAQEIGGTPVQGLIPIKRTTSSFIDKTSSTTTRINGAAKMLSAAAITPTGNSAEVGITEGELAVSLTGGASYAIPIAVPPGINGVVPQIGLVYNSQGGNGLAGYGWNIAGVSVITRIPSTKFHDGIIDGVDFNDLDRFAFDGQRLVVKTGTSGSYGATATVYETESFSTVKITSYGVHPNGANYGPAYFIVEYPDGSKAYYGNSSDSLSINDWAITYWENPQGVRISYAYNNANNSLSIASINYGSLLGATAINKIQFTYKSRQRPEQSYIGGQSFLTNSILNDVKVIGNGIGFRNYTLAYDVTSLGYERLTSITEKSGDNTKSYNPTVFSYENTAETISYGGVGADLSAGNINSQNSATLTGDFDGDGKMDFLLYPTTGTASKAKYWLFTDISSQTSLNLGYEHPVGKFDDIFTVSWLNFNNKLMPIQGWTVLKGLSTDATTFTTYSTGTANPIYFQNEKSYQFPKFTYYDDYNCGGNPNDPQPYISSGSGSPYDTMEEAPPQPVPVEIIVPKSSYDGDFNGDGLTDVVIIEKSISYYNNAGCYGYNRTRPGGTAYFVNLDRRMNDNFVNQAGYITSKDNSVFKVADFNGDGKSDILVFDAGYVNVYTLNDNNYFVLLYQKPTSDAHIVLDKPILMGDYNGDGKIDFIIPKAYGNNYAKYTSTGNSYIKSDVSYSIPYQQNNSADTFQIIPQDLNNDGKTDLILSRTYRNNTGQTATIGGVNSYQKGFVSMRLFRNMDSNFVSDIYTDTGLQSNILAYPLPIVLTADKPNRNLEIAFISDKKIHYFQSQKDFNKERLLRTITTGNGVTESITYQPLDSHSNEGYNSIYTHSGYTEVYPNVDIVVAPTFQVVTKLEKQSSNVYKKQLFSYYGAVSNVEGIGFLGFRGTMRTNWHDDATTPTSSISKNDISLRGANIENYSVLYLASPSSSTTPSNFITKSLVTYESELLPNKVYKIKNTFSQQFNGLDNTSNENSAIYDEYNNLTQSTTLLKQAGVTQQTTTTNLTYATPTTTPYYVVGRPTNKTQSAVVTGDTMTSEEQYTYNTGGLLTKIMKQGHNTNFITEDNVYDTFGNITKKTISAPGLSSRVTNYEYEGSGRFLTKSTDIEGLSTTFVYNTANGLLNSETNPYGLTTSYTYDFLFKKTKATDYLGKSVIVTYSKNGGDSSIVTTSDDGSATEEFFDDLGRKIKSGAKDISGNFSYVSYGYDNYDRNTKVSEPYFGTSPTQWNETQYDTYGRLLKSIAFTGKTVNMTYTGLVTKVDDGTKIKESTKNTIGNVVTMKDTPGGTINYTYFANGNLKSSDYDGVVTTIEQNGWGRKTKLTDPSAGPYTYAYNIFGETLSETTPNGSTTYTLDPATGKLINKTIVGTNTNTATTYNYDSASKLLNSSSFVDARENNATTTTVYTYDSTKRVVSSTETTPYATFTKQLTYDAFGRLNTVTSIASATGKSSAKTVQHTYKNGQAWQIIDTANSQVLWQTNTTNARGQLTAATMGNGNIAITNTYDQYGFGTQFKHDRVGITPGNVMTLNTVFDPLKGNLSSRTNSLFNWNENFQYDSLDRLTTYTNAQGLQETQTYDDRGRITENAVGTYAYTNNAKAYQNTSVALSPQSNAFYKNREGIFNDDFEQQKNWDIYEPSVFTYDSTASKTGTVSLKINNNTSGEKVVHSSVWIPIDNAVATEYTYSAWVKSSGPQAELFLFMKTNTEAGYYTLVSQKVTDVINDWVLIENNFLVPANIKKLNLRLDNNGLGNVWFDDVKIRKTDNPVTADRELRVTYNTFKSPSEIEETGVDIISFTYNDDNSRSTMFYGGTGLKETRQYRKYYSADGSMEIKQNMVTGAVEFVTYIGGDGYTAPLVVKSDGTTQNYLYLHRDYQGSILAITNSLGQVVEKRLFDAWGNIAKVQDGAGNTLNGLTILDRGYTGHEHLQSVGLIHMNGRLYDPKLHRFLQPDNYIQDPSNTQNYNRYGYCWNNPLKYSDPSGEFTWSDLFAAAAIVAGVIVVIASAGTLTPVAQYLIGAGAAHFLGTFAMYANNGYKNWDAASNYIGIQSPTINIKTGWGDSKPSKNGVIQNESVVKPKTVEEVKGHKGEELNPSTVGQNLPLLGGRSTYAGGDNPKTYNKDYTYSYVPTMITDYPAIGHDRRYDNLGITGKRGLFFDTRAIGADWKFVSEQFQLAVIMPDQVTKSNALILGVGLGAFAIPKTIYQITKPTGFAEIMMWYYYSSVGVTNKPGK